MTARNMNGSRPSLKESKMQVVIDLNIEQVSRMVYQDLLDTRECFLEDLENGSAAVFSTAEVYDRILIEKHIEALDLILEWYRDPSA